MLGLLQTRPGLFLALCRRPTGGREGGLTVIKAPTTAHAHPIALMRNEGRTADGRTDADMTLAAAPRTKVRE